MGSGQIAKCRSKFTALISVNKNFVIMKNVLCGVFIIGSISLTIVALTIIDRDRKDIISFLRSPFPVARFCDSRII